MPKSPRHPAIAAPGINNDVPTVTAENIRAAPPVTIGKTTKESSSSSKLSSTNSPNAKSKNGFPFPSQIDPVCSL